MTAASKTRYVVTAPDAETAKILSHEFTSLALSDQQAQHTVQSASKGTTVVVDFEPAVIEGVIAKFPGAGYRINDPESKLG